MQSRELAAFRDSETQGSRLSLVTLAAILAATAGLLMRLAGPPHLPARIPSWLDIEVTLRGSDVPLAGLGYLFTTAAWLVWLWIAGTLVLQIVLVLGERWSDGAPSVRAIRRAVNSVTLPVVRRAAEAVFGALLLVSVTVQAAPIAAAAPAPAPIAAVTKQAESALDTPPSQSTAEIQYIVQPGDNLWAISQRFYGTGFEYPRLVEANAGRHMADGRVFSRDGVIQSGWVLLVPLPSTSVEEVDGHGFYTVETDDTLSGIAARLLGDEAKWPEIFQLNAGKASLRGGTVLTDPNMIWPGLRLELPAAVIVAPPEPHHAPPPAPVTSLPPQPPVPTPAASSPLASAAPQTPQQAASPAVSSKAAPGRSGPPPALYVAGAAATLVTAAALGRRRFRRSLSELPAPDEADVVLHEGFAEADTGRAFRRRMAGADVEPVQLLAEHAQLFLEGRGLRDARILAARHGRSSAAVTIACGFVDQPRVIELAAEFGRRVGTQPQAMANADQDVIWQLSGLKVQTLPSPSPLPSARPVLIPVGVLPSKQILYGNWNELGNVLVAGLAGGGADVVMTSLLSALAARRPPHHLRLHTLGTDRGLPSGVLRFPHQTGTATDPVDEAAVSDFIDRLNHALNERISAADIEPTEQPDMVIVIEELAALSPVWERLEMVAAQGPAYGMRLLAATGAPHLLNPDAVTHFGTRLVLQTLDGDQGMLLIGQPDAADLHPGELLLRLDGRRPVRARGFRLPPEYLDELAGMMIDAYTGATASPPQTADAPVEAGLSDATAAPAGAERQDAADNDAQHALGPQAVDEAGEPEVASISPATEAVATSDHGNSAGISQPEMAETAGPEPPVRHTAVQTMLPLGSKGDDGCEPVDGEPPSDARLESESKLMAGRKAPARALVDVLNGGTEPPIQVECFGALRVLYGDRDLTSEDGAAHHKAWELLAFIGSRPTGTVSREKLLDALWPDLELDRADNALRQIRFRLRNHLAQQVPDLGGDVIRSERDGTCRLNPQLAGSDVRRFWALCRAIPRLGPEVLIDAYDELASLYRSDLLIEPCYEWVHEREDGGLSLQERFREEFRRITKHVARLCYESGHPERAVPLYRRLLLAEPTLEDVARELYRCYQQLGDRSALIREHRHLRQAIQQMFADPDDPEDSEIYDPDPETVSIYEQALAAMERAGAHRAETA